MLLQDHHAGQTDRKQKGLVPFIAISNQSNKTKRLGRQTHLVLGSFSFPLAARYSWSFLHLSSAKCGHAQTTET